jgi:hypothetical protein
MKPLLYPFLILIGAPFVGCGGSATDDISAHIESFKDDSEDGMVQARAMYALVRLQDLPRFEAERAGHQRKDDGRHPLLRH